MLQRIQARARLHLPEWSLVLVGLGFLTVLAELLVTRHTDGPQIMAVVAALIGLLLAGAAFLLHGRAAVWAAVLLALLAISGPIGVAEHAQRRGFPPGFPSEGRFEQPEGFQRRSIPVARAQGLPAPSFRRREMPPPFAPLALSGLALFGAVATLARVPGDSTGGGPAGSKRS
ncbi:hypothetical protein U7230_09305 [Carboxydochorda subterranea]|uniref:Uncharacterized protein n=1 Tax=Carboxydichorda subterranea TaxID=3109565 RepID=A0ABZ1BUG9_9FIRM|nr:hypothetical protein [Limnochorda sp. L945t]WRP16298.1 hypothetical protein U7230_09305 [Limnochorda sp. L945t]